MCATYVQPLFSEYPTIAAKAVRCIVFKVFPRFFSEVEIEDLISTVIEKMLTNEYNPERGAVSTWAGMIAKSVVFTEAKRKGQHSGVITPVGRLQSLPKTRPDFERTDSYCPDFSTRHRESEQEFFGKLTTERERQLLRWQIDGLSRNEMAQKAGVSLNNIYVALNRLRAKLRQAA